MSNSQVQQQFIEAPAARWGLGNIEVVTAEVGEFEPPGRFDRVVSVEMLEHVRNHESSWGAWRRG